VFALMQFVFAPVLGNLSDRFGRRPVLLFAVGALGVDYLVMGFAPTLAWLFVGRAISGIAGASFTPAYAYVSDIAPPEKRAQSFGMVSAMFGAGFILGPAMGGLLGGLGPRAPFFAAAGIALINFLYGFFVLPESLPVERRRPFELRRANPVGTLLQMRKHPVVLGLLGSLFLWSMANQVMPATWSYYVKLRFNWNETLIGLSLALAGGVMVLSQAVFLRMLSPRLGPRRSALLGIAVAAVGYVGYGLATASWMLLAWLATWFLGATVMPNANALMSHRIPPNAQGELQGAVASLFSLAAIVGPVLMAQLFGRFSAADAHPHVPGMAFFAAGALALGCFVVFFVSTSGPEPARAEPGAA
jgi:DHA1 family tetracycline resistance protein-like MFS transporter